MASIYDTFADTFAALAAKSKRETDKAHLLQLADEWRTVPADRLEPGGSCLVPATLAGATENVGPLLARPTLPCVHAEIASNQKRLESNPKRAKERSLVRAREAIGVLRRA